MLTNVKDSVFIKSSCTCMARVKDGDDANITQAGTSTITYSVFSLGASGVRSVVTGHDGGSVSVATSVFNTLQTDDSRWDRDTTGYNFLHTIDISSNEAFTTTGKYLVEYLITPVSPGQRSVLRFLIVAK